MQRVRLSTLTGVCEGESANRSGTQRGWDHGESGWPVDVHAQAHAEIHRMKRRSRCSRDRLGPWPHPTDGSEAILTLQGSGVLSGACLAAVMGTAAETRVLYRRGGTATASG